jgi:hypothetical protein
LLRAPMLDINAYSRQSTIVRPHIAAAERAQTLWDRRRLMVEGPLGDDKTGQDGG